MTRKRATSHDVARLAGVSRATVSLVLNDVRTVTLKEETRERVIAAARELDYFPNAAGRALASQKTRSIGLVHSDFNPIRTSLLAAIRGLTHVTNQYSHRLVVDVNPAVHNAGSLLELVRAKHIDGLLMFESHLHDPVLNGLVEEGFPVVLMGTVDNDRLCSVDMDNRAGAREVVEHLIGLGHRSIACIPQSELQHTAARNRYSGYRDALAAHDLYWDESAVCPADETPESGYQAMDRLLQDATEMPTAVFVTNDAVAIGAMRRLHDAGILIPDDIAVAGYDDLPLARYYQPPLTTMHYSPEEQGTRAAELLLRLIDGEAEPGCRVGLETLLMVRESTVGRLTESRG